MRNVYTKRPVFTTGARPPADKKSTGIDRGRGIVLAISLDSLPSRGLCYDQIRSDCFALPYFDFRMRVV
jgi:hypothetical protein